MPIQPTEHLSINDPRLPSTLGFFDYEVYSADSLEEAKAFLEKVSIIEARRYVIVETPDGIVGRDNGGIYRPSHGWRGNDLDEPGRAARITIDDVKQAKNASEQIAHWWPHFEQTKQVQITHAAPISSLLPTGAKGNPEHIATLVDIMHRIRREFRALIDSGVTHSMVIVESSKGFKAEWNQWRESITAPIDLRGADLTNCLFFGFDFTGVNMSSVKFCRGYLFMCKFNGANLENADFSQVETGLSVDFAGANLRNANFSKAKLISVSADSQTELVGANFDKCKLDHGGVSFVDGFVAFKARMSDSQIKQLKSCFIATAACGDIQAWEVVVLQDFRDTILSRTALGCCMIRIYEALSPTIAEAITRHPRVQKVTRRNFVKPLAMLARKALSRNHGSIL